MLLVELTSTPSEDLPLDAFKAHLKLGRGFEDDGLQDEVLESYIRASLAAIEARTGKMLLARRVSWTLTRWADPCNQALPVSPVSEIHAISVTDRNGTDSAVPAESYGLQRDTHRPRVVAVSSLPVIPVAGSVTLTFEAGFGPDWSDVPADLREAAFLLAAHYYEHRRDTSGAAGLMPFGVMGLLEPHRNIRLLGGRV